jgi:hypothetical protein
MNTFRPAHRPHPARPRAVAAAVLLLALAALSGCDRKPADAPRPSTAPPAAEPAPQASAPRS